MEGQGVFGSFWGCLPKGTRRKGGTRKKPWRTHWICTQTNQKIKRSKDRSLRHLPHVELPKQKDRSLPPGSHTNPAFVIPVNPSLLCPSSGLGRLDDVCVTTQSDDQTQVLAACQTSCSGQKTQ